MKIQSMNRNSIEDVVNLRISYFMEAYKDFTLEQEQDMIVTLTQYFNDMINEDIVVLVVYEGSKAVSCAILGICKKTPNLRVPNGRYGEITGVYTLPSYRCKGYATLLVNNLILFAKQYELSYLALDASEAGMGVYEKCGFSTVDNGYTQMKYYFEGKTVLR